MIELTYLLFLKMAQETRTESHLPEGYRWDDLEGRSEKQLEFYKVLLGYLGSHGSTLVKEIVADAHSLITKDSTLSTLVTEIDMKLL